MTEYRYPADEFDEPNDNRPRSVHRAPRGWWSRWGAFVVVLVVVPLIAVAAVTWLSGWEPGPGPDVPSAGETDPGASDDPTAEEPTDPEPEPTETETTEPEPEPEPEPDLRKAVLVLNATRTSGLAAGGAEVLGQAGFTSTSTGNWRGEPRSTSVVLYAAPEDEVTARAVAAALGITGVEQSDTDGIVAVLAQDYAG